jgi:hypothetical protein
LRRRDFIQAIVGSAAAWPLAAGAQQPGGMPRILSVFAENDPEPQAWNRELLERLQGLGWSNGRNVGALLVTALLPSSTRSSIASSTLQRRSANRTLFAAVRESSFGTKRTSCD